MIIGRPTGSTATAGNFSYDDGTPFRFFVSGVDRSGMYDTKSLKLHRQLASQATVSITLLDASKSFHVLVGEPVQLYLSGDLIFGGDIEEVREDQAIHGKLNKITIRCLDHERRSTRYLIAKNYELEDQTMRDVVRDSLDVQTPLGITDGVGLIMSDPGPEISPFVIDYKTFKSFLDTLVRETGHCFYFTPDGDLVVETLGLSPAPVSLSDAAKQHDSFNITKSRSKYRNVQYLRAGAQKTTLQSDTFKGDGETKNFPLRFKVDNDPDVLKPTFKVNDIAVSSSLVGIKGTADDEDFEWLYSVGENQVSQGPDETALLSSDKLTVEYIGQVPTIILEENSGQIIARQVIEGGSGRYENLEQDEEITSRDAAVSRTEGFLSRFGEITESLKFRTQVDGFDPGQILNVDLTDHGLNKDFLVQSVRLLDRGNENLWYDIQAASPPEEMESWVEFFAKFFSGGKKVDISRQNEKLLIVRKKEEQVDLTDDFEALDGASVESSILDPDTFDPYTAAVIGDLGDATKPSMVIGYALIGLQDYQK